MAAEGKSGSEVSPERCKPFSATKFRDALLRRGRDKKLTSPKDDTGSDLPQYAVLVPLIIKDCTPHLLLTVRSSAMSLHPGHVSFPGGKRDPDDADLVDTALREAQEEIGLPRANVTVLASIHPVTIELNTMSVTAVVGIVRNFDESSAKLNPLEVASVFTAPLEMFIRRENLRYKQGEYNGKSFTMNYFRVAQSDAHIIWGFTALVCTLVASVYFDRIPDFEYTWIVGAKNNLDVMRAYISDKYLTSQL